MARLSACSGQPANLLHQCVLVPDQAQLFRLTAGNLENARAALHTDSISAGGNSGEWPLVRARKAITEHDLVAIRQEVVDDEAEMRWNECQVSYLS